MIYKRMKIRVCYKKWYHHISGKFYYYLGKKRSYVGKPSELNFYQKNIVYQQLIVLSYFLAMLATCLTE